MSYAIEKDMRLGIWNVRCLSRSGPLKTAARELEINKLDLVGAQEIRGANWANFLRRKRKSSIRDRMFCKPQNSISSYGVEFVSETM
jgi:D-alanine-D-alanine ligase-like ATP-grasp enzyme